MDPLDLIKQHEAYRSKTLNLIASENIMSLTARKTLSSDLVHRYSDAEFYGGAKFAEELVHYTNNLILQIFGGEYASCEPLSGNLAHIAPLIAFSKPGDKVAVIRPEDGGYPFRYTDFHRKSVFLPFDTYTFNIDINRANELIARERPKIVFLGASIILYPQPVKAISEIAHDHGSIVVYDASHVLGLIAGGLFQKPLEEGADILVSSTHKTLGGPQGGLVIANDRELGQKLDHVINRPPLLVDNPHLHRIGALAITLVEMKMFGEAYAKQIVKNSRTLASELHKCGLPVFGKELGFTETHQIYLLMQQNEGKQFRDTLEEALIIVDALVRIGTQEVSRKGMKESEMRLIANAIDLALKRNFAESKKIVRTLTQAFRDVHYSLDSQAQGGI